VVRSVASQTVGFALADEDRERLDRLVEHFGGGNRSAYLRATDQWKMLAEGTC
jgi:predicted DNA-binding protein